MIFGEPSPKKQISISPAEEIADEKATTDRTSRELFWLEDELRGYCDFLVRPFLMRSVEDIRWGVPYIGLPLDEKYGVIQLNPMAYYAPPGVEMFMWKYGLKQHKDFTDSPRLLICSRIPGISEFPFYGPNRASNGVPGQSEQEAIQSFSYQCPTMLLVRLTAIGQVIWDWSDIQAIEGKSFSPVLMTLRFSAKETFAPGKGVVSRILNALCHREERMAVEDERPTWVSGSGPVPRRHRQ